MTAGGTMRLVLMSILLAVLTACGSGGGVTGNAVDPGTTPDPTATKADVTIRTQAVSAETVLYGVELLLNLPFGVTVASLPDGSVASSALDAAVGVTLARYLPPTATSPAGIMIQAADPGGFTAGNLATVHCSISNGAKVNSTSFTVSDFTARDENGVEITGISPRLSVQIQ